jgi:penicillin-binding protein 1C
MQDWARTWRDRKAGHGWRRKFRFDKASILKYLGLAALFGTILAILGGFALFAWYARSLPDPNTIVRQNGFSTKITDRNGQTLYELYQDYNRIPIKLADIPQNVQQATISIEDKEFYSHQGFSVTGYLRGFLRLITTGRAIGGSTLTQQLVKNVLLNSDRTVTRKIKELVLAMEIEKKFTKDEILQMYLNEAPYGGTAIGIASASDRYFGIAPKDLTLTQAAILAGMPQAPSAYSPYGSNNKAYISRATDVLRRMREDGKISVDQEKASVAELPNVQFKPQSAALKAPHFVFYVKDQLVNLLGEAVVEQGGYTVTTTLDSTLQDAAQTAVADEVGKLANVHVTNGAAMVMNPQNGEILAMVGSKDYFASDYDGQVNVVMSLRQPGSSIKPVTYATAFAKGYSPASMLLDVPTKFPGATADQPYEPKNYDGKFRGPVQLRYALGSSLNIPAVKLLSLVGMKDMMQQAYDMGFDSLQPTAANMSRFGLSVTLGGGEVRLFDLVHAYSAFANGGYRVEPVSILKVEKDGKILYQAQQAQKQQVISPEVAFLINNVLSDNTARLLTFGVNSYLNMNGKPIAVKTGTTNDKRDNWTIGWSTSAVVGVWVGNNDNSAMKEVASGVTGASPIWRRIILKAWDLYKGDNFNQPSDIVQQDADNISGYPAHDGYPSHPDFFVKGTVPTTPDPVHTKVHLCSSDTTKLASDIDVARGAFTDQEFYVIKQEPTQNWTDDIQSWIDSQPNPKYKVPTQYCATNTDVVIGFNAPNDHQEFDSSDKVQPANVSIKLTVTTSKNIDSIKLYDNGSQIESYTGGYVDSTVTLSTGAHELRAHVQTTDGAGNDTTIHIGVNHAWNYAPSPTPTPVPVLPAPTASASATPKI